MILRTCRPLAAGGGEAEGARPLLPREGGGGAAGGLLRRAARSRRPPFPSSRRRRRARRRLTYRAGRSVSRPLRTHPGRSRREPPPSRRPLTVLLRERAPCGRRIPLSG